MAELSITWDTAALIPFKQGKISSALFSTVKQAGGDGLRTLRTYGSRYVRNRKGLKLKRVREGLTPHFPRGGRSTDDLVWTLRIDGSPIPVADYPYRQQRRGVKVRINKGSPKLIAGAFVATMKSGHVGVFVREGKRRLPIRELYSSTLANVFGDTGMVQKGFDEVKAKMQATYDRLLPAALAKSLK